MIRVVVAAFSVSTVIALSVAADDKKAPVQPIPVVVLDRKEPVAYEKEIEPILVKKCQYCHTGSVKEGQLELGSFEGLMQGGKRGKAVVPGKSAESLLVQMAGKTKKPFMPPKTEEPLTPEELALIKLWIDQGGKPPTGVRERPKVLVQALPANVHPVRAVAVSPDKSAIAAARGNVIHIYNAVNGNYVRTLTDSSVVGPDKKPLSASHLSLVESLAFSNDSRYLASGSFQEVTLWDLHTGMLRQKITGFADRVVALAFSADSKQLAAAGGAPTENGELRVFEVATQKLIVDIKNAHSDQVFGVAFSPDGTKLASCGADKFVKTFEMPSGKFIKAFEGHTHHVLDVGWKADGKLLASAGADNDVKVWDFEKGEQTRTIKGHTKQVTRLHFIGATGQIVTCSGDQTIRFWNVDNGGNVRNFAGNNDFLYGVGVSPDGALVVAGGEEGIVRVYNGANGNLVKQLAPPGAATPPAKN